MVTDEGRPWLIISTNHLMFPLTALGIPSEAELRLVNVGEETLSWNIFGYSVPYLVKVSGSSGVGHISVGTFPILSLVYRNYC